MSSPAIFGMPEPKEAAVLYKNVVLILLLILLLLDVFVTYS